MKPRAPIYAGRGERLFAYLIDTLILLIPGTLIVALFPGNGLAILASFLYTLTYYVYFTASSWQATPGKRLLGVYVIRVDGRRLGNREALERFLAYCLPSLPLYTSFIPGDAVPMLVIWLSLFWFAPILFTDERIGYHDRLCKTRVVVGKADA